MAAPSTAWFLPGILLALALGAFAGAYGYHLHTRRAAASDPDQRRLAAVGAATARILHQVKNPLQSILLHVDLLQSSAARGGAAVPAEVCDAIGSEAERLAAMLTELSLYVTGAAQVLRPEPVSLHDLVRELAERVGREGRLAVDATRIEECVVLADPYYMRQALENLISNACDAMRDREGARLTLRLERRAGEAVVGVIDTGAGIPADRLGSIFQPFVTGKSRGMGLGLAISREIVEGHGGRIEVSSTPGLETHFRVLLPLFGHKRREEVRAG